MFASVSEECTASIFRVEETLSLFYLEEPLSLFYLNDGDSTFSETSVSHPGRW
jgi:hypothetical protein